MAQWKEGAGENVTNFCNKSRYKQNLRQAPSLKGDDLQTQWHVPKRVFEPVYKITRVTETINKIMVNIGYTHALIMSSVCPAIEPVDVDG